MVTRIIAPGMKMLTLSGLLSEQEAISEISKKKYKYDKKEKGLSDLFLKKLSNDHTGKTYIFAFKKYPSPN